MGHSEECKSQARSTEETRCITPYTYKDLARIPELQEALNEDIMLPCRIIHRALEEYIRGKIHRSKVSTLRRELQTQRFGTAAQAAQQLPALMKILQADGHVVDVQILNAASVTALIMRQRQSQFESQQKALPAAERKQWASVGEEEKASVSQLFARDSEDTKYVAGWHIVFRTAKAMIPFLVPVVFTDGTFIRSKVGGVLYCTVALDANHKLVPLAISWFLGGESIAGWSAHANFVAQFLPEGFRVIIDGTVAGIAAWELCLQAKSGKMLLCSVHFAKTIKSTPLQMFYHSALKAATVQDFNQIKRNSKITDAQYDSLVQRHGSERLFMRECGELHGNSCQSCVESLNNALLPARRSPNHVGKTKLT